MLKMLTKIVFTFILVLGFLQFSNSQDNPWGKQDVAPGYSSSNLDYSKISNTNISHPVVKKADDRIVSAEEKQLLAEQRSAKIAGDQQKVLELDRKLDKVRGITVSLVPESNGATVTAAQRSPFINGDVNTTLIWNSGVKGLATATEQVGANTGRIWAFVMRDTTSTVVDRATLYYSDNGGLTWNAYLFLTLGGTDKFQSNTADIEILEGASGDKYMWVVYEWRVGGISGAEKVGMMGVDITTFSAGVYALAWPGNDNAKRYYRPRIASDNPNFAPASTWLFIVCSFDSLAGSFYENCQKYAEVHNPTNVTAATVTYKGPLFSWYMGFAANLYRRDLHSDIAYWRNAASGDSVIVSFSNIPDSTRIFIAAGQEGTYTVNSSTRTGTNTNYHQQYTYLFSPSTTVGQNIVMVTRRNFTNSGDWDVYNYRSTNGCIPGASWSGGYIDGFASTTTAPGPSAVYGKKGVLDYRVAYTYDNTSLDSVMYSAFNGSTWSAARRVSYIDSSPFYAAPKPGFRTGGGDDCFILWAVYNNNQVWSSRLCSGTVGISNNNNSVPHEYSLSQNYPNPFNPATTINFALPKAGFVNIAVYDITGKLVANVVNSEFQAGYHTVNFDASNVASGLYFYKIEAGTFKDTKKMVLVK